MDVRFGERGETPPKRCRTEGGEEQLRKRSRNRKGKVKATPG